jgi:ribonuclease Y
LSKLEERAETTRDALSAELKAGYEAQAELDAQRNAQQLIIHTEGYAPQRAHELLSLNCQRYDDPRPAERLMGYVNLPRSAKKREALLHTDGTLISALGDVTGVEFVLEGEREPRLALRNAPESFTKEVARLTFDRWLQGGLLTEQALRTHHRKAQTLLERQCHEAGASAARRLNLKRVHPEILYLVGKLLFRTSYTQNQWQHAIEAAELSGLIAEEIGLDPTLAKRATLLHDIGKVLWAETEAVGSHAVSGAAFARERGELPEVVHPIAAHHHDEAPSSALAYLVIASDTLSGARPGARRETSEAFSQHVEQLEGLCAGLPHVRHHMVIQGGREVRLQLDERRYTDLEVARLGERLAVEIEDECVFPGQIKVTALRELVSYATAHTRRRYADPHTQHQVITNLGDRLSGGAWRGGEVRG